AENVLQAWNKALECDPVSAFGGILITNTQVDKDTALEINKLFFEVLIAPEYTEDALEVLTEKKNRIILRRKDHELSKKQYKSLLNGVIEQDKDLVIEGEDQMEVVSETRPTSAQLEDLLFANKVVKHTKSNAIVLAAGGQLFASGVGQTSRVDALKQAIEKARSFNFDLSKAVMASDAFFPFPDCVEIAAEAGIKAVVQPGGSIKDKLSIEMANQKGVAMVTTGVRHFKH
ncbi:MAG TPA: bifunctional phosphoribosylaminoimidazolecarboxamide formyltransferase/IMP cyclohydrolase PurH, partial [Candidatus Sphingobacterium stercoripullorum]|nr:bifunctional phosphoribosylaminoimidazolecarboxamide formyltransferase/IMP cyclohydrolase PurH [Candidatus Sphingobacterium stercoripullorum]